MGTNATINIHGAREHNLKNINIQLPKNKLIVFTGVSGSGKSSLAMDTLYAEGQRRYIESLSAYARQFLGQLHKPEVDEIIGLSPSIAIDQGSTGHNPRSTVATVTEIYDYLRVLYARAGQFHCPECGQPVGSQSASDIQNAILSLPPRTRILILAPIVRRRRGEHRLALADALKTGFVRARIDGDIHEIRPQMSLNPNQRHDIDIVVDRIIVKEGIEERVAEAVEQGLKLGNESLIVHIVGAERTRGTGFPRPTEAERNDEIGEDRLFSTEYVCGQCSISYEVPEPRHFSYNTPEGQCPTCKGLGSQKGISPALIIPDETLSIRDGAIALWGRPDSKQNAVIRALARHLGFEADAPWKELAPEHQHAILYGTGDTPLSFTQLPAKGSSRLRRYRGRFQGIIPAQEQVYQGLAEEALPEFFVDMPCRDCNGSRLTPTVNAVTLNGTPITAVLAMSVENAAAFFNALELPPRQAFIATELLKEIRARLGFLQHVGLGYLTLARAAPTLSGGEAQRIRLASQVGAGLRDVTYVLDEPSIGLHPRDNAGLLSTLLNLRNQGNTVIVVEHDEATMRVADWIVDFGPGAGVKGGNVTAMGTPARIQYESDSLTAQYLRGDKQIVQPASRRPGNEKWVQICGARQNNLKGIHPKIPLGTLCCVTGVSGSGKSSLVHDILYNALARDLMRAKTVPGAYEKIQGLVLTKKQSRGTGPRPTGSEDIVEEETVVPVAEVIDKIIHIDMAPIGRTPRSNPATYTKVFDAIRSFYASLAESKLRGYKPGRFSFNVTGGRCEACNGNGAKKVDMGLLSDVWVECEICEGHRYNSETLTVKYKDKSIADVLEMDVDVALAHFTDIPKIARPLKLLHDVGLDYIKLGQPAPTLSGGEAQRIKLSRELSKRSTGKTLYLLDEPTTGLHFDDVNKLLSILHRLVDTGNTVVVVEHNLEVIQSADYLIDLGPEGGMNGGNIVAVGTPEEVAEVPESYTGQALRGQFHIKNVGIHNVNDELGKTTCKPQENLSERIANNENITVRGAEENNLKNIDVDIPHGKLTVLTGVSGSGKTSLALDTLYAEGQRRYIETLNTYARQFIGQMEKPKVAKIDGLSPAIAISHTSPTQQPRSTVATITEIHDGLRTLYARWGQPHCPDCLEPVQPQTAEEIAETVFAARRGTYVDVLAPLTNYRMAGKNIGMDIDATPGLKGNEDFSQAFIRLRKEGFARVQINGKMHRLEEAPLLHKGIRQEVLLVIDRVELVAEEKSRFMEAVELALSQGEGFVAIQESQAGKIKVERIARYEKFFSEHAVCPSCGSNFPQLTPRHFSFNNKLGACGFCDGIGRQPFGTTITPGQPPEVCSHCNGTRLQPFPSHVMFCKKTIAAVMNLSITEIIQFLEERVDAIETELAANPESAKRIEEVKGPTTSRATHPSLHAHTSPEFEAEVLRHLQTRLRFLEDIGLGYLELARPAPTLSGGEIRRIRLASQLGSGLTGVTYILDEPSIGLHPRDQGKLIAAMKALRDIGNSVLVVEHDKDTILAADRLIDFGPRAGEHGGEIVAAGEPQAFVVRNASDNISGARTHLAVEPSMPTFSGVTSLTQAYLSGAMEIPVPKKRRKGIGKSLTLTGVQTNNLKDIDVTFPLGTLIAVTGVSGCGKSSLIDGTLRPALESRRTVQTGEAEGEFDYARHRKTMEEKQQQGKPVYQDIRGVTAVKRLINVAQKPIGETPRSNPATYTELFTKIRAVFAKQPDAQRLGFGMARFSFNLNYGQCEQCDGHRFTRVEMHFLPDVWIPCEACGSTGYNAETLSVRYKGKNIAEVLQLTVAEALELFSDIDNIRQPLEVLTAVGLDYLPLGQSATTLSGGEAQRIKLAKELARHHPGSTLYLMDEPTTGLHVDDVQKLLKVLNQLVDAGNTIIAVEHNLDVIKSADWVIDLGPEGSKGGGEIVATGTPEKIADARASHTGRFLREVLS